MSKSIQLKNINNEKMYPHPYYPIGSIYLSINDTNPSKWFGGTWEQIAKGRTLVGVDTNDTDFNTVKKTGGEKTHTLTVDEMPSHNHLFDRTSSGTGWTDYAIVDSAVSVNNQWGVHFEIASGYYASNARMTETGGSKSHNNLQPYFACYIWCRTA